MKVRPLIIDDNLRAEVKRVMDYARANIRTIDDNLDVMNNPEIAAGSNPGYVLSTTFGYRVVFTIEQVIVSTPRKEGRTELARRMSVSVYEDFMLPSVESVEAFMDLFGFKRKHILPPATDGFDFKIERITPGQSAIQLVELLNKKHEQQKT